MIKVYLVLISVLLVIIGCNNNISTGPIIEEKQSDHFNLVIKTNRGIYKKGENIEIDSYLEYVGEEEIKLTEEPLITIIIKNKGNGSIFKQVYFEDVKTTMKKGDKTSQKIIDLKLEKGEYEVFVQVAPFIAGTTTYSLNTVPRIVEVK